MVENAKGRIAKLRKRLAIPRDLYVMAVKRQEDRVWAYWGDARRFNELKKLLHEAGNAIRSDEGLEPKPYVADEPKREPDPAACHSEESIARDDAIITAFLKENSKERLRSNARGQTYKELFKYWKSTDIGQWNLAEEIRRTKPKLEEVYNRIMAE